MDAPWSGKMAQQIEAHAAKPDCLSLIPGPHMVRKR